MRESPIFVKTYDFLQWLLPLTTKFPKSQRFLLAERLGVAALDFYELLQQAAMKDRPEGDPAVTMSLSEQADLLLHRQRFYVRLIRGLLFISKGQYEHAARHLDEIGRLLGGWMRRLRRHSIPGDSSP
jgi:hypothetical protein